MERHNEIIGSKKNNAKKSYFVTSSFRYFVSKGGFTVIEMLTVTLIAAVLFAIGARTYFDERDRFVYNNALTKTIEIIKVARNSATTSRSVYVDVKSGPNPGMQNVVPPSGYGVRINLDPADDEPHLILFASTGIGLDGDESILNKVYDGGVLKSPDDIADVILEEFRLPKQLKFEYLIWDDGGAGGYKEKWNPGNPPSTPAKATANAIDIFFRPPLADIYMQGWLIDPITEIGAKTEHLEEIGLRFFNPSAPVGSPKRCQYIMLKRVRAFPVIKYSDCDNDPGVKQP